MPRTLFKLGKIRVEIDGDHSIVELVCRELAPCTVDDATSDIRFILTERALPDIPRDAKSIGSVFALPDRVWIHWDAIGYRVLVSWAQNAKPKVNVQVQVLPVRRRLFIPTVVYRWRNWTYLSPLEQRAYSFINGVLESVLLFFGEGTGLLHASAVEREGQAVLFPSTGGTGKTTLSLLLVKRHGFKYLADDIALVTADGQVHLYPRYIMIYAYSLQGFNDIERLFLQKRNLGDRIHWVFMKRMRGPKGVRRRVSPTELYGGNIATTAPIHRVLFLVRYPGDEFRKVEVSPAELAKMSSQIILCEYSFYISYLRYWEATGHAPLNVNELQVRMSDLYKQAFAHALECAVIHILFGATPHMLERYITGVLKDD